MKLCVLCGKEVKIDNKYFTKKSTCPECRGDLRICLNCRFYSETSHNKCLEQKAEFQRSRDRANFCDYFVFGEAATASSDKDKEDAKRRLEALFKKP